MASPGKARFLDQSRDNFLAGLGKACRCGARPGASRQGLVWQGFILKGCNYEIGSM